MTGKCSGSHMLAWSVLDLKAFDIDITYLQVVFRVTVSVSQGM